MTCDRGVSFEVLKSESSIFEKKKSLGREVCFLNSKIYAGVVENVKEVVVLR